MTEQKPADKWANGDADGDFFRELLEEETLVAVSSFTCDVALSTFLIKRKRAKNTTNRFRRTRRQRRKVLQLPKQIGKEKKKLFKTKVSFPWEKPLAFWTSRRVWRALASASSSTRSTASTFCRLTVSAVMSAFDNSLLRCNKDTAKKSHWLAEMNKQTWIWAISASITAVRRLMAVNSLARSCFFLDISTCWSRTFSISNAYEALASQWMLLSKSIFWKYVNVLFRGTFVPLPCTIR